MQCSAYISLLQEFLCIVKNKGPILENQLLALTGVLINRTAHLQ
uniref:Uncharacterized protein n=1 Tax=Lotus japonicus TaxID=34305 RepID=I3S843_LOTJA|nr:unknown [Lotus japonicus]